MPNPSNLCDVISRVESINEILTLKNNNLKNFNNFTSSKIRDVFFSNQRTQKEQPIPVFVISGTNCYGGISEIKYFYCKKQMEQELKQIQKYIESFK